MSQLWSLQQAASHGPVMMLRLHNVLRRVIARRSVGHSSNFGKTLSKEQQEYTSTYLSACALEPPQVSHVSFWRANQNGDMSLR